MIEWQQVKLKDFCNPKQHKTIPTKNLTPEGYPVFGANGQIGYYSEYSHPNSTIAITCRGATCGQINLAPPKSYINGNAMALNDLDTERVDQAFLIYALQFKGFKSIITGAAQPQITRAPLLNYTISLPNLSEQRRIAKILGQAAELVRLRKETLAKLDVLGQAIFHDMFGDLRQNTNGYDQIKLTDALIFKTGKLDSNASTPDGKYPFFTCAKEVSAIDTYAFDTEALLLAGNNASGDYDVKYYKGKFNAYQRTYVIKINHEGLEYQFVQRFLELMLKDLKRYSKGSNTKYLTMEILSRMKLSIPSKELQRDYIKKMRFVTAQQQTAQRALVTSENLSRALQQQAFSGLI